MRPFTALPNDICMAILGRGFTARQMRILLFVARYTYGFHLAGAVLKNGHFRLIGLYKGVVRSELRKLADAKVLAGDGRQTRWSINPNVAEWKVPRHGTIAPDDVLNLITEVSSMQFRRGTKSRTPSAAEADGSSAAALIKKFKERKEIWGRKSRFPGEGH